MCLLMFQTLILMFQMLFLTIETNLCKDLPDRVVSDSVSVMVITIADRTAEALYSPYYIVRVLARVVVFFLSFHSFAREATVPVIVSNDGVGFHVWAENVYTGERREAFADNVMTARVKARYLRALVVLDVMV